MSFFKFQGVTTKVDVSLEYSRPYLRMQILPCILVTDAEKRYMSGIEMVTLQDKLEEALRNSETSPVFLFKHSTRCPISARSYSEFQNFVASFDEPVPICCLMLRVIEERSISDWVARTLGVKHESPQILVVSAGRVVWHASHYDLTKDAMQNVLSGLLRK